MIAETSAAAAEGIERQLVGVAERQNYLQSLRSAGEHTFSNQTDDSENFRVN